MRNHPLSDSLRISGVYIGTVLGAGFASGQEMLKFFAYYGYKGMFGLLLTGMLFGIISYMILYIVRYEECSSYQDFMEELTGKGFSSIFNIFVLFFMFICFCAMFAGAGALLAQRYNQPYFLGVILMGIGCFIAFLFDIKGVITVNAALSPILLAGCVLMGLYMWFFRAQPASVTILQVLHAARDNWLSSALIYTAYNIITAAVVLSALRNLLKHRSAPFISSFISGTALGLIGLVLGAVILIYYHDVKELEIPLLGIVTRYAEFIQSIYIIVLISAMFTTAVANGYGIIQRLREYSFLKRLSNNTIILLVIVSAALFSRIGFSNMVSKVYPVFGYVGLLQIIIISVFYIRLRIQTLKKKP